VRRQVGALVALLLASLPRLGANAHLARRLVAALAQHAPGRAALRAGAARWQAPPGAGGAGGGAPAGAPAGAKQALQWAVTRLWQQGTLAPPALPRCAAVAMRHGREVGVTACAQSCGTLALPVLVRGRRSACPHPATCVSGSL